MHHEEERHQEWHERPQHRHRHPRHEQEEREQHFRNRWDEPTPFNHDRERQEYYQSRAQQQHYFNREQRQQDQYREDINRHQHGFSTDHDQRMPEERREWRSEDLGFSPHNQHARDRWQQPEHMPPLREQRHRRHSRRDEDWDERGW